VSVVEIPVVHQPGILRVDEVKDIGGGSFSKEL
jgi:hypothetical protein